MIINNISITKKDMAPYVIHDTPKTQYPINTFRSQAVIGYNFAIDYYYQKFNTFFNLMRNSLNNIYNEEISTVDSIEDVIKNNQHFINVWENIQSQNTSALIQKFKMVSEQLKSCENNFIEVATILNFLTEDKSLQINSENFPGTISVSLLQSKISTFLKGNQNTRMIGGARADLIGEIFEQCAGQVIADQFQGLVQTLQTGNKLTNSVGGYTVKAKSDYQYHLVNEPGGLQKYADNKYIINLEASELFDLREKASREKAIKEYIQKNGATLGASMKSWTGLGGGSMGSSSITANLINSHTGGVSNYFKQINFRNYTAFILSKYLINVIGVYNALMSTSSQGIVPTYIWLQQLYMSGYQIQHSLNIRDSVFTNLEADTGIADEDNTRNYVARDKIIIGKRR